MDGRRLLAGTIWFPGSSECEVLPEDRFRRICLPASQFGYEAFKDGLIVDAWKLLGLDRLGGGDKHVRQLQFLTGHRVGRHTMSVAGPHVFTHTRWQHSLGVGGLMDALSQNLQMEEVDCRLAILSGASHDGATTAAGDAAKNLFQDDKQCRLFVDEDEQFLFTFKEHNRGWKQLARQYELPPTSLFRMADGVRGFGLLGHLLNIADSSAYVSLDVAELEADQRRIFGQRFSEYCPLAYREIFELASHQPCAFWKSVELRDGVPVVRDTKILGDFLKLRVLLWKMLYTSAATKYLEYLFIYVLAPYLLECGRIDITGFRRWDDTRLYHLIEEVFEGAVATDLNALGQPPALELYSDKSSALKREKELVDRGAFTLLVACSRQQKIKTKTENYFVLTPSGSVYTYQKAFPRQSETLKNLAEGSMQRSQWALYYVEYSLFSPRMSTNLESAWSRARVKWMK